MKILVTGGAGFIGSAVCRLLVGELGHTVVNVDKLTYASSLASLQVLEDNPKYVFSRTDIGDRGAILDLMRAHGVEAVMHLAAESHVDRSIDSPGDFVATNVVGTYQLLEASRQYVSELPEAGRAGFRFHHVSTDEVFGDLPFDGGLFDEETPYAPSSPYSASKAASDHFVRAWSHTYGLPVVLSNCSNNYGPYQFPEKLIPLSILNALEGLPVRLYGRGENVRDWVHVEDHARALVAVLTRGRIGETYLVGARAERPNAAVVEAICDLVDARVGLRDGRRRRELITLVTDRPGHDRRYAIDPSKVESELGWRPSQTFEDGLAGTIDWFIENRDWWIELRSSRYAGERLGTPGARG